MSPRSSCKDVFKSKKMLIVPCLYIYKSVIITKENSNLFTYTTNIHTYHTRQKRYIFVERQHFATTHSSVYSLCTRLYNKLPNYLKSINNINKFKSELFKILVNKDYYDVNDNLSDDSLFNM